MVKIWDRKESINGVSSETILANREDIQNASEVILIGDIYGNITNIEFPNTLRAILVCDPTLPALEVGQAYEQYLIQQREAQTVG